MKFSKAFQSYFEPKKGVHSFEDCMNDLNEFFDCTNADPENITGEDLERFIEQKKATGTLNGRALTSVQMYIDFINQYQQPENDQYLQSFVEHLEERSPLTISSYVSDVKQFLGFIDEDVAELDKNDIEGFKDHLKEKGFKVKTINRKLVSVKQFIDFLNEKEKLAIAVTVKPEKQQRQDYLEEMLDKKDFEKMVAAAGNDIRAKAIFYTLLYTGVRVSEMLQIEIGDIEKPHITIKGKGSKYRDTFIPPRVRTVWTEYLQERHKTSNKLFTGQRGPINRQTVHAIIKKYAEKAGVLEERAHAHSFRHLYCKMLIDKGYSIDTVADLAGHSDINTTRIYTRKTRTELVAAINDL